MIKVTADSTCDLSQDIIDAMDITILPLYVYIGDKIYRDGVDIRPADIFRRVDEEGKTCKTAAINVFDYERVFGEFSEKYDAVIHINISTYFSSCYQNAVIAAKNFKNVYVVDSRNLSSGSGHIVYDAAIMAKEGVAPEEICRRLKETVPKVDASFLIDRMDYLYKGGRCSGLEAIGAKLLQIKPCIEVVDGQMKVGKKYRGNFDVCLDHYVRDRLQDLSDVDLSRIFITHPQCRPETVEKVRKTILQCADFGQIIETPAGCTVSCHCGPYTLGILFKRKSPKKLQ